MSVNQLVDHQKTEIVYLMTYQAKISNIWLFWVLCQCTKLNKFGCYEDKRNLKASSWSVGHFLFFGSILMRFLHSFLSRLQRDTTEKQESTRLSVQNQYSVTTVWKSYFGPRIKNIYSISLKNSFKSIKTRKGATANIFLSFFFFSLGSSINPSIFYK